ncbi:MAG: hypothetical protein ACOC7W_08775, partial [Desulfosalsimonas sp.]
ALGVVEELAVSVAATNIQAFLGLMARAGSSRPDPSYAVLAGRGQYNALSILQELSQHLDRNVLRLGIINGDLCLPFLSFIYGEAQLKGKTAVVSLHRLRRNPDGKKVPSEIFLQRLAKIAIHETAHVIGLRHCRVPGCVMCFSPELDFLDALSPGFCSECESGLMQRLQA